ncbi:MAG TPA: ABC transporter ATP-binding protein [Solirubrobacteraceae bacterium]|nr:ABC transporter ATP-binding protein [Solirubrobacteraceae bacterium]
MTTIPQKPPSASEPRGGETAVSINGISKRFVLPDRELVALHDISLEVRDGEFLSLIGPSGCGKSTLLRLVAGLIEPSSGSISIGDESPAQARARYDLGFVFQEPTLLPWRTSLENVTLLLDVARRGSTAERRRRGLELLDLVGLRDFADAHPAKLSGGMQRRVGIARALALDPRILLLDEPFGALDEITRQRMNMELLRVWAQQRTTALLVTHNVGEAVFLSDRVLVMGTRPGRIIAEVTVDLPRPRRLDLLQTERFFALSAGLTRLLLDDSEEAAV